MQYINQCETISKVSWCSKTFKISWCSLIRRKAGLHCSFCCCTCLRGFWEHKNCQNWKTGCLIYNLFEVFKWFLILWISFCYRIVSRPIFSIYVEWQLRSYNRLKPCLFFWTRTLIYKVLVFLSFFRLHRRLLSLFMFNLRKNILNRVYRELCHVCSSCVFCQTTDIFEIYAGQVSCFWICTVYLY